MTQLEIANLPLREKLHLMESLWDSLCHEPTGEPVMPSWHGEVLAERLAWLDAGQETVSSWDEAKQRIRAKAEQG
ncbi:MAG: addiction module protein [Pseudomonadota bacterium]|nr:addiction module protein [Pseudomonadota bacterium]